MAIIIEKKSKCPMCGDLLEDFEEYVLVPPLIGNIKDSLFIFSDAGIHNSCLNRSKLKSKLIKHIDLHNSHLPASRLKCHVDGKLIDNPGELLYFGLLTSDETEELSDFNYLAFGLKRINKWIGLSQFLTVAEKFLSEEKWVGLNDFNKLKYLLEQIKGNH